MEMYFGESSGSQPLWLNKLLKVAGLVLVTTLFFGCGAGSGKSQARSQTSSTTTIQGSAAVVNSAGQSYGIEQAEVTIQGIETSFRVVGVGKLPTEQLLGRALTTVGGSVELQVETGDILADQLYAVAFQCPALAICELRTPLHVVLTGAQLLAGQWQANALTEMAYQKVAYYVSAGYSADQMQQTLDNLASWMLLRDLSNDGTVSYQDILNWRAELATAANHLRKPTQLANIADQLSNELSNNQLKVLAQELVSPLQVSLDVNADIRHASFNAQYGFLLTDSGLLVVDHTEPEPRVLSLSSQWPSLLALVTKDELGFSVSNVQTNEQDSGLFRVLDFSNLAAPTLLAELAINPIYEGSGALSYDVLSVVGDYVLVATAEKLQVINISDPAAPYLVETEAALALDGPSLANAMRVMNDIAVIATPYSVQFVDVSDPLEPVYLGARWYAGTTKVHAEDQNILSISTAADYVVLSKGIHGVEILQMDLSGGLVEVADVAVPGFSLNAAIEGDQLYVSDAFSATLRSYQIEDIQNPVFQARVNVVDPVAELVVEPQRLLLADRQGVRAIQRSLVTGLTPVNVATLATTRPARSLLLTATAGVLGAGNSLYPLSQQDDALGLAMPISVNNISNALVFESPYLYLANASTGLRVLEVDSDSTTIIKLGEAIQPLVSDNFTDLVLSPGYLFAAAGGAGLAVFDLSNPALPVFLGNKFIGGTAGAVALSGSDLFVSSTESLAHLRFEPGLGIKEISSTRLAEPSKLSALSLTLVDGYLYATDSLNGLRVFDVRDLDSVKVLTIQDLDIMPKVIVAEGPLAYVGDERSTLHVLDIRDPSKPQILGSADLLGTANDIQIKDGLVYVATSYGIEVLKTLSEDLPTP